MSIFNDIESYMDHMNSIVDIDHYEDEIIHTTATEDPDVANRDVASYFAYLNNSAWRSKGYEDNNYADIYRSKEFNEAVTKVMDMRDRKTRKWVLSLHEADQSALLKSLTSKLYDIIVKKIDDIDYGAIPSSKGEIEKIPNYAETCECLDLIRQIIIQYHEKPDTVDEINKAIANMIKRTSIFTKAYNRHCEFVMNIYCNICLAIIASTSYMISACIEFVKTPSNDSFDITLDRISYNKTKNALLLNILKNFNKSCSNGDLDKAMSAVMEPSNRKNFTEGSVAATVGAMAGIKFISAVALILTCALPILRMLVYYFFHMRTKISDYFAIQADLLQMNAMNLQMSSKDIADKDNIVERQMNIVNIFRKASNLFAINNRKAEIDASKDATLDEKKNQLSDIKNELPDNMNSVLF